MFQITILGTTHHICGWPCKIDNPNQPVPLHDANAYSDGKAVYSFADAGTTKKPGAATHQA